MQPILFRTSHLMTSSMNLASKCNLWKRSLIPRCTVSFLMMDYFQLRILYIIVSLLIILGSGQGHMVYFYSRTKQELVPRLLLRSKTKGITQKCDDKDLEATQVIVTLPSLDQEAGQSAEEILCDRCFLEAINVALSPTTEFKFYVQQLRLLYYAKITKTRKHSKKL